MKEFITKNIEKVAKGLSFEDCANDIPDYTFTKEEVSTISYIQKMLPLACARYLKNEILLEDLVSKANYIMFDRYNPSMLSRLLKKDLCDFIMLLGEADYCLE
ncbi:TPA: hypothetical protein GX533_02600 [Candidatus Dojkabacteria bacterium]|uniref:Uncharacterized protein n=1 Tax=Candidatus Dojkabacteria bacterium TaxID=2099670 RepID=A0A832R8Q0_9BACT|nr:hypothetical protein [Candidatus Dojkabacteria bacterium]